MSTATKTSQGITSMAERKPGYGYVICVTPKTKSARAKLKGGICGFHIPYPENFWQIDQLSAALPFTEVDGIRYAIKAGGSEGETASVRWSLRMYGSHALCRLMEKWRTKRDRRPPEKRTLVATIGPKLLFAADKQEAIAGVYGGLREALDRGARDRSTKQEFAVEVRIWRLEGRPTSKE